MFTGADIRISKSSILYNYNLCTSVAVKSQARANSMLVSLQQHHFVGKWNTDSQIKKGDSSGMVFNTHYSDCKKKTIKNNM